MPESAITGSATGTLNYIDIAETITIGRRGCFIAGTEIEDYHICITPVRETTLPDGTVIKTGLKEVRINLSDLLAYPEAAVFQPFKDTIIKIMRGDIVPLKVEEEPTTEVV